MSLKSYDWTGKFARMWKTGAWACILISLSLCARLMESCEKNGGDEMVNLFWRRLLDGERNGDCRVCGWGEPHSMRWGKPKVCQIYWRRDPIPTWALHDCYLRQMSPHLSKVLSLNTNLYYCLVCIKKIQYIHSIHPDHHDLTSTYAVSTEHNWSIKP